MEIYPLIMLSLFSCCLWLRFASFSVLCLFMRILVVFFCMRELLWNDCCFCEILPLPFDSVRCWDLFVRFVVVTSCGFYLALKVVEIFSFTAWSDEFSFMSLVAVISNTVEGCGVCVRFG